MLAFTPLVERALDWFKWTHEVTQYGWRRRDLPDAGRGGVAKQDAKLLLMLDEIRHEANAVLVEQMDERRRRADVDRWRDERAAALR